MSRLNGRVTKLEERTGLLLGKWHPTNPPAWSALGTLLDHGFDAMYWAAAMYEAGRTDELIKKWAELARSKRSASHTPKVLRQEHWDWALEALRRAIPDWRQNPWWQESERELIADLLAEGKVTEAEVREAYPQCADEIIALAEGRNEHQE